MMQLHLKGHQFTSKTMRKRVSSQQRKWMKMKLSGKKIGGTKKKPNEGVKRAPEVPAYPCSPKAMALGERGDNT